jgi:alanyl-tRNA synthetase
MLLISLIWTNDVLEIWNIVLCSLIESSTSLRTLPNQHIDTGMGGSEETCGLSYKIRI